MEREGAGGFDRVGCFLRAGPKEDEQRRGSATGPDLAILAMDQKGPAFFQGRDGFLQRRSKGWCGSFLATGRGRTMVPAEAPAVGIAHGPAVVAQFSFADEAENEINPCFFDGGEVRGEVSLRSRDSAKEDSRLGMQGLDSWGLEFA